MNRVIKFRYRILALLALAVILSAATYGFAAANTVDPSVAGEGAGVISGYDVTGITYTLNVSDPTQFASVAFTLDASATNVYVGLVGTGGIDWTSSCNTGPATSFTCSLAGNGVSVAAATALHVASVQ